MRNFATMLVGDVIEGRFELQSKAGSGGMGTVWRATDRLDGATIALKVLRDANSGDVSRFMHEGRILSVLEHPHIVRYIGHGMVSSGEPYLAMEWLDGMDLENRINSSGLTLEETLTLTKCIASALATAHARGVVHRDIKPSNIFLMHGDISRVKLLDFGIARFSGTSAPLTHTGSVLGTPGYMAPEQARSERLMGPPVDVFSLGCVVFECLTGTPAFRGNHPLALLAKLLFDETPLVSEKRADIPEALDKLVAHMMAKDPAQRLEHGAAILAAIENVQLTNPRNAQSVQLPSVAITYTEQRTVSVVVAMPKWEPAGDSESATILASPLPPKLIAELERAIAPFGAKMEALASGMLMVVVVGTGAATDQAALAARCALEIRARLPTAPMALFTGRSDATRRLPVGDVLEKAAAFTERLDDSVELGIQIDDATRAWLDPRFEIVEETGRFLLRGERAIGDEARTLLGKPSPFVGRDRELRRLLEFIDDSIEEKRARVIVVTAPAGTGKTRLRHELLRSLRRSDAEVAIAIGRADSFGASAAFALVASALRGSMGIEAGESIESQRAKVSLAVQTFVESDSAARVTEFLGELVGAPFPDDASPRLRAARQNAQTMAEQITAAFIDFSRFVVQTRPALIILEDLHWGDAASVKLLDIALRDLHDQPFVVLAFARPEVEDTFPKLWKTRDLTEIRLAALSHRAATSLVRNILGQTVDAATEAAIVERADGNAFYLEELIRAFAEGRGNALPETVMGMVEARLATLLPEVRRVLRAASIFGDTFWTHGLRTLLGPDGHLVESSLETLVAQEFISSQKSRRFVGEEEFAFRHGLVRETAYRMLVDADRVLGHHLAGQWLERVGEPDPVVLAEHFERGKNQARAAFWHYQASERALASGDVSAALTAAGRGIDVEPQDELRAQLWAVQSLAASGFASGRFSLAVTAANESLRLAKPGSATYCQALGGGIAGALMGGDINAFMGYMGPLLATEPEPAGMVHLAGAFAAAVGALVFAGQREPSAMFLGRMRAILGTERLDLVSSAWLGNATANWERYVERQPWAAWRASVNAERDFDAAGNPLVYTVTTGWGQDCTLLGAFDEAEQHLLGLIAKARPESMAAVFARYNLACVYLEKALPVETIDAAMATLKESALQGGELFNASVNLVLSEAYLMLDQSDEAKRALETSGSGASGIWIYDMWARRIQAKIRLANGQAAEAAIEAEETIALCKAAGVYDYRFASTLLLRAEAHHAAGNIDAATSAIREAHEDLLQRASKIDDPTYRKSFLTCVRDHVRTLELADAWAGVI
jgi:tetratricopeptide (TPR) repeat protein